MTSLVSVEANQRWREQQHLGAPSTPVGMGTGRGQDVLSSAGHTDATARLVDMDRDGVDASVTYCEVSAFRYLYLVREGRPESTRAFNDALMEFASADHDRLIVSCQIPIHDIDEAVAEVHWAAARRRASRCSCRCSRAELGARRTTGTRATTRCSRLIEETGLPDLLPHRDEHDARRSRPA